MYCNEVNENGIPCRKRINENLGYHGGGHMFMSLETERVLMEEHFDATALLNGKAVSHHKPENCGPDCIWYGMENLV